MIESLIFGGVSSLAEINRLHGLVHIFRVHQSYLPSFALQFQNYGCHVLLLQLRVVLRPIHFVLCLYPTSLRVTVLNHEIYLRRLNLLRG